MKSGSFTFSEVDELITKNYITTNDKSFPTFPLGSINKNSNGYECVGNDTFFENFATGEYGQNPLTVKYFLNSNIDSVNSQRSVYLQKTNTTVYNIGKTMNVYFWNFANETEYIGSTTSLNGLEDVKPAVKNSIYTNVADEINNKTDITIDTDKTYDNTDEQIADIAQDNDLDLKVIEDNTEEITDNTKGIWETVKSILGSITSLPRKIYNFFSGILNKILNAVKSNPLNVFGYFADPLFAIETAVKNGVENIVANLPKSITNNFPSLDKVQSVLDKMDLNLSTVMCSLLDIAGGSNIGQITNIGRIIENIAGDTVLGDIVAAIDNLPFNNLLRLIENLPQTLTYGNIVTAINNLPMNKILTAIENLPNTLSLGNIDTAFTTGIQTALNTLSATATDILTSLGNLADNITKPVISTLTTLFVPDTAAITSAIDDLKSNFAFVGDFKAIVGSIIDTAIEPHDYITIYNWNKDGNKYDNRDSYRIYFTWYAPYRPYVNAIIIALVYLIFVWRIFIKLPSIISGTGGGIDAIFGMNETANDIVANRQQIFKNGG